MYDSPQEQEQEQERPAGSGTRRSGEGPGASSRSSGKEEPGLGQERDSGVRKDGEQDPVTGKVEFIP